MTVEEFAKAAWHPKELIVVLCGAEYNLINSYDGEVDKHMLSLFGDYLVESFKCNEPDKYNVWILELPVKKVDKA